MKKKKLNYLDMVPVRNLENFTTNEGKITLLVPKFKKEWMKKWLIPQRKTDQMRIHLDNTGSAVWNLIDGQRTVAQICNLLRQNHGEDEKFSLHLEEKTVKFLNELHKSHFIRMAELND